jgi:hypothetical protein
MFRCAATGYDSRERLRTVPETGVILPWFGYGFGYGGQGPVSPGGACPAATWRGVAGHSGHAAGLHSPHPVAVEDEQFGEGPALER